VAEQRILLIRLSHLGDVVHALPVFHALRAAHPEAELGWLVQSEFAGLLRGLPGLSALLTFERRGGARAWLELRAALAAFAPELVVDAQGNLKSALAALAAGSARRLGFARPDWREPAGALVLTEQARPAAGEHALERMAALARAAAGPAWSGELCFDLGLSAAERAHASERWRALVPRSPAGPAALVVHLADPSDVRSWPAEHFAALGQALAERGIPALYVSGPAEEAVGRALQRSLGDRAAHWVGQRGLRELAALFSAAAADGARFLGCDSGPMHLAAAAGLPVTCLSGPQSHLRTGPWPLAGGAHGPHRVLRAALPPACAPCLRRSCDHHQGTVCMRGIAPEAVLAALAPLAPLAPLTSGARGARATAP
jgi:heptosyltransferase-1